MDMKSLIRVLHLEDSPRDAEVVQHKLESGGLGCEIVLVDSKEGFESALARDVYDVILCDHNLPGYDGRSAIKLARERLPLVPVISLSGTLGEEEAVECLKQGATDYVLKQRLERLVPAVKRALQEAEERRARLQAEAASRETEEQFRSMFEVASIGMAQADPRTGQWLRVNQKMCAITGYSAAELLKMRVSELTHPDDRQEDWEKFQRVLRGEAADYRLEKRYVRKDGTVAWVNVNMTVIRDAAGQPTRTMATIEDITKRKQTEQRVGELNRVLRATGAVNALMVRERDPKRLLAEASQILVDTRGYRFVWIGLVETGSKRVVSQAHAGKNTGYFDTLTITWDETPTGRGPIGTAIRTGQQVVCQDIATDPRLAPWREDAKARGIASMAATPMIHGSRVLGAVAVFSAGAGAFDAEELGLLNELASDLAFALQSIEHEQAHQRAEREREKNLQWLQGVNQLHQSLLAQAPLEDKLKSVADNVVRIFGADFCRVWLVRPGDLCESGCVHAGVEEGPDVCRYRDLCLHLLASSGRYTHTDGKVHRRVPFGAYKIGRIASGEDHKFVTNDVANDPLVPNHEWARELGLVSFAGYQLRIPGVDTLGVLALFAKHPILPTEDNLLDGLSSALAQVIQQAQSQEMIRASEEKYRGLFESSRDAIMTIEPPSGRFVSGNPATVKMFGAENHDELLALEPSDMSPERQPNGCSSAEKAREMIETAMRNGSHFFEWMNRRIGGEEFPVDVLLTRIESGGKVMVQACVRDITERKRAEESNARLVTAVEQSAETIVITDASGAILYANPAFEKTSGYTRAEALGQNPRILKSDKHDAEFYRQIWAVLVRGEVWNGRLVNKKKDGTLYEEDVTISPMRDLAGKVINYVAVKRDVSREAQLESQLRQAQKMEAVGQLAGGIAHDFNNMLAVMRGNADLLLLDADQFSASALECLGHIISASNRAANLTRQLLIFSRKQAMQSQPVALNDLIRNLAKMLKRTIREDIRLECVYADPLPFIQADSGMLEQVLLNLVVNARDAMPHGGQLHITTEKLSLDAAHAQANPEARAGEFVCLSVSDNGMGITPEHLPRVFEPFFTTKEPDKGTGLGLATVYGIVKQHQGWIELTSQVGAGTRFNIFLPAIPAPVPTASTHGAEPTVRGGTEGILLVEDDFAVRTITQNLLETKGYRVWNAESGQEALEVWRAHAAEVDLLLTDLVMPGTLTGRELATRLHGEKPQLKVIFMSGYSPEAGGGKTDFVSRLSACFLSKPCAARTLLEAVRSCLDDLVTPKTGKP
jgi:two-component system, cell cycle sensor histidine kinase and response regulator CckA